MGGKQKNWTPAQRDAKNRRGREYRLRKKNRDLEVILSMMRPRTSVAGQALTLADYKAMEPNLTRPLTGNGPMMRRNFTPDLR